jgi:hypothetical protein
MHRAKTNRSSRVRMEAWRQWSTRRGEKNLVQRCQTRIILTPTGLLMEGDFTNYAEMGVRQSIDVIDSMTMSAPTPE